MTTRESKESKESVIRIAPIQTQTIRVPVRGTRPLVLNRLAEKARQELLLPSLRATSSATRASTLKHDPMEEFRAAPYLLPEGSPTLLAHLASAFKGAMMTTALDLPDSKKSQIGRLVWVEGERVAIYGIPRIFLAMVRQAGINRTPDVRTRVIVPDWAAMVTITFATPIMNETSIVNLLAAAGMIAGIGDWRPEKGKGTYGQFVLTDPEEDGAWQQIVARGGRAAQEAAMANPEPYDDESEELLTWFNGEIARRGKTVKAGKAA